MFEKPRRRVRRVFLHCSASDNPAHDNIATMRRWHRARGWRDVGYHYFIRKDGTLEAGRSLEQTPAAQAGHNRGTIAICCHGLEKPYFTSAQQAALKQLCSAINRAYGGHVSFHGHREVAAKACPVYDYRRWLGLDAYGNFSGSGLIAQHPGLLQEGDNGPDVRALQQRLNIFDDGIFGPITRRALAAWQKAHGLKPDGIAGAKTAKALGL